MSEDGEIDYSKCTMDELIEAKSTISQSLYPKNYGNLCTAIETLKARQYDAAPTSELKPKVDVQAPGFSAPEIPVFSLGPRCPVCGWKKPLLLAGTRFGEPFDCRDCLTRLQIGPIHRHITKFLWALLIPAIAWVSFGGLSVTEKVVVAGIAFSLSILEYGFTRLEVYDRQDRN